MGKPLGARGVPLLAGQAVGNCLAGNPYTPAGALAVKLPVAPTRIHTRFRAHDVIEPCSNPCKKVCPAR